MRTEEKTGVETMELGSPSRLPLIYHIFAFCYGYNFHYFRCVNYRHSHVAANYFLSRTNRSCQWRQLLFNEINVSNWFSIKGKPLFNFFYFQLKKKLKKSSFLSFHFFSFNKFGNFFF